jgi:hypothetical protein
MAHCCKSATINFKGKPLDSVGLSFPETVVAHGQLYVALSRVTLVHNMDNIGIVLEDVSNSETGNVVNIALLKSNLQNQTAD